MGGWVGSPVVLVAGLVADTWSIPSTTPVGVPPLPVMALWVVHRQLPTTTSGCSLTAMPKAGPSPTPPPRVRPDPPPPLTPSAEPLSFFTSRAPP